MNERDLVHHGLAIKRHADAAAVAGLVGLPSARVAELLSVSAASGRALATRGAFTLTPLARAALDGAYLRDFGALRADPDFSSAYERFEVVNRSLKQVVTDWQTVDVRGERVANDHSDKAHDARIIDRLGQVHEQVEPLLEALARGLPRLGVYRSKLTHALERAEDGEIEWVSDIRRESYHTVWFELHEDLLRIMGRQRDE